MKKIAILLRVVLGFIGFIMILNEQQYPEPQNWWVNILGVILLLLACSNKNTFKYIKSVL